MLIRTAGLKQNLVIPVTRSQGAIQPNYDQLLEEELNFSELANDLAGIFDNL